MNKTKIEWTDYTWNPIRARRRDGSGRVAGHYCEKVSSGCSHCYSSALQRRFQMPEFGGRGGAGGDLEVYLDEKAIQKALRFRPRPPFKSPDGRPKVFVCDMSDLFGEWVPFDMLDRIFAAMALRPDVMWLLLTKRPERAWEYLTGKGGIFHPEGRIQAHQFLIGAKLPEWNWPLPNVALGTSVENNDQLPRIEHLLQCPAALRFVSFEPLLGPILANRWLKPSGAPGQCFSIDGQWWHAPGTCRSCCPGIDWAIIGGESGPNARPCDIEWIRSLVGQCAAAEIPAFVKQLGSRVWMLDEMMTRNTPALMQWEAVQHPGGTCCRCIRDPKGGNPDYWPEDLRVRQFPERISP